MSSTLSVRPAPRVHYAWVIAATTFLVRPGPDLPVEPLLAREWDLDPQSDRVGVRLRGEPIAAPAASCSRLPCRSFRSFSKKVAWGKRRSP